MLTLMLEYFLFSVAAADTLTSKPNGFSDRKPLWFLGSGWLDKKNQNLNFQGFECHYVILSCSCSTPVVQDVQAKVVEKSQVK